MRDHKAHCESLSAKWKVPGIIIIIIIIIQNSTEPAAEPQSFINTPNL